MDQRKDMEQDEFQYESDVEEQAANEEPEYTEEEADYPEEGEATVNEMGVSSDLSDPYDMFVATLEHFQDIVAGLKPLPFSKNAMVNVSELDGIARILTDCLPESIEYGMRLYKEYDRIRDTAEGQAQSRVATAELKAKRMVENAQAEAERMVREAEEEARAIIEDAEQRKEQMISQSEIVAEARDEARNIRNDARVEANEYKLKMRHDVSVMISKVEERLRSNLEDVQRLTHDVSDDNGYMG